MINRIAVTGIHAAEILSRCQKPSKKDESGQESTTVENATTKPAPSAPGKHTPPGLARAAERIASKIFLRADADGNGTVTQQELSAIHSRHARTLASGDLFGPSAPEPTGTPATTETKTDVGVSETQLKEALTKLFYARVGVTYAPITAPASEQPDSITPTSSTTSPVVDSTSGAPSNPTLDAAA